MPTALFCPVTGRGAGKGPVDQGIPFFTPSAAKAPEVIGELRVVKADLGLDEPVRDSGHNAMIFCTLR